ncbi:MAG: hypothetical protein Q8L78_00690 [Coxiellaceae bacterium]|nr:hypothetical protein [Coxiellaceae bacterium]
MLSFASYAVEMPYMTSGLESGSQAPWNAGVWWPTTSDNLNYFFTGVDGSYGISDGNGSVELGADYRRLLSNGWALGGYGFAAYNDATSGQSFFTLNPGIELLNRAWHFNWNLYLPISATSQGSGNWVWANSVGIYNYTHFQEHNQYDQLVQAASSISTGTDFIVSYRFHHLANIQASTGIYYFNMDPRGMGYVAMLTSPTIRHTSFNIAFTHDPLTSNSVLFGFTLHFGNQESQETEWINSAVQHNLPAIGTANTIPIETGYRASGQNQLQQDNVWFFNTTGTAYNSSNGLQNCTFEHPCSGLSSTNLQSIASVATGSGFSDNPSIYLASGSYTAPVLVLYNNESLVGRNNNYTQPAMGDDRPSLTTDQLLIDAAYNNQINSVENLRFLNDGGLYAAIGVVNTNQTILNNIMIGASDMTFPNQNYITGLFLDHSKQVIVNSSTMIVNNALSGSFADITGINDAGTENLLIENSVINSVIASASNINAEGLYVNTDGSITVKNSIFNQEASGTAANAINILTNGGIAPTISIDDSHFNATTNGDGGSANNFTLQGSSSAIVNNSILKANITSVATNQNSVGIQLYDNADLTLNHSSVVSNAESSSGAAAATNIFAFDDSQLTLNYSNLTASGHSALVTGSTNVTAENNSVITINGGNFNVAMSGGPTIGEPSGAVALWAINNATMNINNAVITATSGNNETGAVALQTQNNAIVTVNDSVMQSLLGYGNITDAASSVIVAGNESNITIHNSRIFAEATGIADHNLVAVEALNSGIIHLASDSITVNNQMTSASADPILTIGVGAANTSTIYLDGINFNLTGEKTQNTETWDSGSIIGS